MVSALFVYLITTLMVLPLLEWYEAHYGHYPILACFSVGIIDYVLVRLVLGEDGKLLSKSFPFNLLVVILAIWVYNRWFACRFFESEEYIG